MHVMQQRAVHSYFTLCEWLQPTTHFFPDPAKQLRAKKASLIPALCLESPKEGGAAPEAPTGGGIGMAGTLFPCILAERIQSIMKEAGKVEAITMCGSSSGSLCAA